MFQAWTPSCARQAWLWLLSSSSPLTVTSTPSPPRPQWRTRSSRSSWVRSSTRRPWTAVRSSPSSHRRAPTSWSTSKRATSPPPSSGSSSTTAWTSWVPLYRTRRPSYDDSGLINVHFVTDPDHWWPRCEEALQGSVKSYQHFCLPQDRISYRGFYKVSICNVWKTKCKSHTFFTASCLK